MATEPVIRPSYDTKNDPVDLPEPGPGKQNPNELERQLDRALEDSMIASDPPATTQPEVIIRSGDGSQGDANADKKGRGKTNPRQ